MVRAITVVAAVLVLLAVGWYFGQRPAAGFRNELAAARESCSERVAAIEERAQMAEARGFLWAAHAELLLSVNDIDERNFGTSAERVARAQDLITHAAALMGSSEDLGNLRDLVESISSRIEALDPAARDMLLRSAADLTRLLQRVGQA